MKKLPLLLLSLFLLVALNLPVYSFASSNPLILSQQPKNDVFLFILSPTLIPCTGGVGMGFIRKLFMTLHINIS